MYRIKTRRLLFLFLFYYYHYNIKSAFFFFADSHSHVNLIIISISDTRIIKWAGCVVFKRGQNKHFIRRGIAIPSYCIATWLRRLWQSDKITRLPQLNNKMDIKDVLLCFAFFFELYHSVRLFSLLHPMDPTYFSFIETKIFWRMVELLTFSLDRLPIYLSSQGFECCLGKTWWERNNISSLMLPALPQLMLFTR